MVPVYKTKQILAVWYIKCGILFCQIFTIHHVHLFKCPMKITHFQSQVLKKQMTL